MKILNLNTKSGVIEYAESGEGKPVLIFHGVPGGCTNGIFLFSELADYGFKLICPSRPGYLGTPLSAGKSIEEQAVAVKNLLDELGIKETAVIASSGGGPYAVMYAAMFPEKVKCLILQSAVSMRMDISPLKKSIYSIVANDVNGNIMKGLSRIFPKMLAIIALLRDSTFSGSELRQEIKTVTSNAGMVSRINESIYTITPFSIRKKGALNDLDNYTEIDELPFDKVTCPVLVIHGTHDSVVIYSHGENSAKKIKNSQFVTMHRGCHAIGFSKDYETIKQQRAEFILSHT